VLGVTSSYRHLGIETEGAVSTIWLDRPDKLNALSEDMWTDLPAAVDDLSNDGTTRVIVVAGRGPAFTAGIDVGFLAGLGAQGPSQASTSRRVYDTVRRLQRTFDSLSESPRPVIAAIHGYCLGAGMSLISACDLRLASRDAVFSIRETKMGLVADVGALQRLPGIVGEAVTVEMALTGDDYPADWALAKGLVSAVLEGHDQLMEAAYELADRVAVNSPLVTEGVKRMVQATRGRTVEETLDLVARWNSAQLLSNDLTEALTAYFEKRDPDYTGT
jgi:enoyl-CoA hydratase